MLSDKIRKIRLIYGCVEAVLLILTAVALISGCVSIYMSGEKPFSREAVADAFDRIDVLVYVTVATSLLGLALPFASEQKKKGGKRQKPASVIDADRASAHDKTVTAVIFIVGAVLFALGLIGGGAADVLAKAVNICTECIGLG